ncbi:hypothetical protein [Gloeocapsopsis dulcis]|uniref:Uncharacterized protein n=1 Tax=Gloeocapsopsis dulcis AAB1 = 1H9 TaxID=1433147 RepID=A0A6N8FNC3_9CHRO|nr:hypothetical protein [Gloeocapsopsis dulcis]MUL34930.1 hypothetical protein [Gloeocapsopsis dulcis AAB1 = 1H9]
MSCQEIILSLFYFSGAIRLAASYLKTQKALQWWSYSQSLKLANEAAQIRNSLLQELCCMRRSIERSITEPGTVRSSQEWIQTVELLHHCLAHLSDRLAPPHVEYSLPLAIEFLIESWQAKNAQLNIKTQLPKLWRDEIPNHSIVILQILDELLRILSVKELTKISLEISLIPLQYKLNELVVTISYPDVQTLLLCSNLKELKYLKQTFSFLTSGQCFCRRKNLTETLYFRWRSPKRN